MIKKLIFTITYVLFAISVNANHEIQKSAWEKSTRKINYKETFKEPDFPENNTEIKPRTKHRRNLSLPPLLMMLPLIVLAVILIVLIILFIKGSYESSISRKVSKEKIIEEIDNPDEFTRSDLDKYLEKALKEKNYRLAIRIHFLMIIKLLQDKELIKWKKEKTNFDYYNELDRIELKDPFRYLIKVFEKVWYANYYINYGLYNELSNQFNNLNNQIEE